MFVFYLDENLHGNTFASVLRDAGLQIELCKDHGFVGVDDTVWIPEVASRGWVILTGDIRTRYVPWEKRVIITSRAQMIHIKSGKSTTHKMLATNFVSSLSIVDKYLSSNEAPCLATLTRPVRPEDTLLGKPGNLNPQKL